MRHRMLLLIVMVMPITLTLVSCGGGGNAQPAPPGGMPAPTVGVASPLEQQLPVVKEVTGQVEAIAVVELRARIGGAVERVLVKDGSEVAEGDAILELDRRPFEASLRAAEANVARADAVLIQARQQFQRAQELLPEHAISQQEFEDLQASLKSVEAQHAAAEAAVSTARLDVGYTHVVAPISGRLGRIEATVGNLVQGVGGNPLTTIVRMDPIDIAFDIDEQTWHRISDRVRAAEKGGPAVVVAAGVGAETAFPHEGALAYADNHIDPRSGAIRIRARFPNSDRGLMPGAFARIRIEVAPPRPVLVINDQALQNQLAMRYVLVVDEHGVTQFRPVQLGEAVGGNLHVVASGLAAQERIVVTGLAKVFFPGMPVSPVLVPMADPGAAGGPEATSPPGATAARPAGAPSAPSATAAAPSPPASPSATAAVPAPTVDPKAGKPAGGRAP